MLKQLTCIFLYLIFSFKARRGLQRQNVCCQNSAQCQPAQRRTPRSVSLRRDGLRAVLACAETDFAQCCGFRLRTVLVNLGLSNNFQNCSENQSFQQIFGIFFLLRTVLNSVKSDSTQCQSAQSHLFREYLGKNESFSKAVLACLSGAQQVKKMLKNLVTLPL